MTSRRSFLTRSGLALGALIVGDAALDAFARLTHVRKSFPSAGIRYKTLADLAKEYHSGHLSRVISELMRRDSRLPHVRWVSRGTV